MSKLSVFVILVLLSVGLAPLPGGALTTTRAQLKNGNELRLEGEDAVANAGILVDGVELGSADGGGDFRIEVTGFSSPTCVISVSDGAQTESVSLSGCTPSGPVPNVAPTAVAGADQTVTDLDGDGIELITLDGSGSSDPEGPIASFSWTEGVTSLGTTTSIIANLSVGAHTITLTVTDSDAVTATDQIVVTVNAAPPPGNQTPIANAGPDQTVTDVGSDGIETVTLDGSASIDPDGTIVSYEWSENGVVLTGGAGTGGGDAPAAPPAATFNNTFDHLFESNQPDPPGTVPNSFGGSAASAGDINGDGFGDIIIGSEVWDAGTEFAEGAAIVFLGGPNGPVGTNPSNANALIEMNQAGATVNDVASAGDVNGDGFDDVLVGSHFYRTVLPGTQLAVDGAVFVFHGGPTGITATGPAQADGAIFANQLNSGMGNQVDSAGDVNGDGYDDIIVSVPNEGTLFPSNIPANDRSGNYGAILVFHGGPNGITGTGFGDADTVILPYEDTGLPLPPVDASVWYGAGAGDINADGFADIVVGGSEITVYFGGPNGIVAQDIFDATDRIFGDPLGTFVVDGAGDLNGDGFADIAVGAPLRDLNPGTVPVEEGAAYVFLGGPTGLGATSVTQADTTILGTITVERVGLSVSGPGDVDADGFDDLIIGALHYAGSLDSEGVAYLYRGSAQGITASTIAEADSRLEARQSGAVRLGNRYGSDAQGAGDVDNDGFIDIIVGKAFYDNGELNEGAAFLYNGEPFPANPNSPPVPNAGVDQQVVDVDADGMITVNVDGSASFDPDGSIVSYEWYMAINNAATGEVLLATGPTATLELPFGSPIPAWGHIVTLVVTDDLGTRRGDTVNIFPQIAPETFEFAEWADLTGWATVGDVTLGDAGNPFPSAPHVLMRGNSTLSRTFTPAAGTTGLDISFWARGDLFGATDEVRVQASFDGGPFVDYFTITSADVSGAFIFYGGSAFPISMAWWPSTASSVTLRFESALSAGADAWLASLSVRSIQAPTGGATNQLPIADPGPDRTVVDVDGNGSEVVTLDGSASVDPDGTITSYEWRDGPVTIGTSAVITPTLVVGSHSLTLIVTDNSGDSDVEAVIITVTDAPPPGGGPTPTLNVDMGVGSHVITLTVTDDQGATAVDTVQVIVQSPATNQPPTANAGPDQTIVDTDGNTLEVVTFDGTGSFDPDGSIVAYNWTLNGNPFGNEATFSVTRPLGTFVVTLTVTDNLGAASSDTVTVIVEAAPTPTNTPPTAVAGPDLDLSDPDGDGVVSAVVDGTTSSDAEGPIASYEWRINGTLVGTAAVQGVVFPIGVNTLELTVRDSDDVAGTDTAIVTVAANQPPTAAAGADQTVVDTNGDGVEAVSVDASGSSDADGAVNFWAWREGPDVLATTETATLSLSVGTHTLQLTVTDNGGAVATDIVVVTVDPVPPVGGQEIIYVSSSSGGSVGGVSFSDEDILSFDPATGAWTKFLDGSDVGLSGAGARDIDAFSVLDDGSVLLSIVGASTLPDVGAVDDSDVVRFIPTSTGPTTAGSFEMYFDGSDVGLTQNGEDIDGISVLPGGDLVVSTSGSPSVPGLPRLADEDLLRFSPTSLGANTAGTWSIYFDGSDVGLATQSSEDIHGVWVDGNGDLYLTTRGSFAIAGAAGTGSDIFTCATPTTGTNTSCGSSSLFFDGSAHGWGSETMDGLHITRI